MSEPLYAADQLLDAWLSLTSTLWNTRVVSSMPFNEAHVMGILLRQSTPDHLLTATDLIRRTHLLKSQMNKILSTLEEKGYIVRTRAHQDRRMAYIQLTDAGKAAYHQEHAGVESLLAQLIDRIGEDRALNIATELTDVVNALDDIFHDR